MSDSRPDTAALEKQIRAFEKKLERSERYRSELEDMRERDQSLHRRLQEEVEMARREAEIEAALERIRAQSLGMAHSSELVATSAVFHEQLLALGVATEISYVWLPDETAGKHQFWATWTMEEDGEPVHRSKAITYDLDKSEPYTAKCFAAWESDEQLLVDFIPPADVASFFAIWEELTGNAEHLSTEHFPEGIYYVEGYMRYGCFGINIRREPTEEERDILRRFAVEFERAYTRFLDLQKAEAQAREAKIEAALERVRSRTMAMHNPDELQDVVTVVAERLMDLGVVIDAGGVIICTYFENSKDVVHWLASPDFSSSKPYLLPYFDHRIFNEAWHSRESGEEFFSKAYSVEDKNSFFQHAFEHSDYKYWPEEIKESILTTEHHALTFAWSKNAAVLIPSFTGVFPSDNDKEILKRFARVFEQAYTRFLDLQAAEAQAREAQIEAALERVRARAMAMRSSDELREMVLVILKEMKALAFPSGRCTIVLFDRETGDSHFWMSGLTDADLPERYFVPYHELPTYKALHDGWRQGIPFFEVELSGEVKRQQDRFFHEETEFSRLPEPAKEGMRSMGDLWLSNASTTHGVVQAVGPEPLSEDNAAILRRFAKVIDLTYTRVEDIQQSEARVREAEQEAALDRVRAEIASMRTAEDLQRITPLIWRELTTLGIPFFRCGVLIADEEAGKAQTYLTTPDGSPIAAFLLPYETVPTIAEAIEHWRQKQAHTDTWSRDQFMKWMGVMIEAGLLERPAQYQGGEAPPESLALLFAPFEQGMLYVGSAEPLAEEAVQAVQALADAFAVAYARYEDFQRLEAKNQEVEAAMTELRAAQAQLVQSEKMASLGALTTGIAHEIKNPLNFVNNFAQISQELVADLEEEEDPAEREVILRDLSANAAKIEEHGKRADAIVRSMMQHASGKEEERRPVVINQLVEEYVNLAYHGKRALRPDANATIERDFGDDVGELTIAAQDIGRVLVNLINNAFDAIFERADSGENGYEPTIRIATSREADCVVIRVSDNGGGIPEEVKKHIFEPFFTTKPTGSGTGLGLSMSYDIVTHGHNGQLTCESVEEEGSTFCIRLPVS